MRQALLQSFAVLAVALLVVAPVAFTENAEAKLKGVTDGPAYTAQWSDSTYSGPLAQNDYNGTAQPIKLQDNAKSGSLGDFTSHSSKDSDIKSTSSEVRMKDGPTRGTYNQFGSLSSLGKYPIGTAQQGDTTYIAASALYKTSGSGTSQVCSNLGSDTSGQVRGLARNPGTFGSNYEFIVSAYDSFVQDVNFYKVDPGLCQIDKVATKNSPGGSGERGLAPHESRSDLVYGVRDGPDSIVTYDLDDGGSRSKVMDIPSGKARGLDVHEFPNGDVRFYVSYISDGEHEVKVLDKNGNVLKTVSDGSEFGPASATWDETSDGKQLVTVEHDQSDPELARLTTIDQWQGDGTGRVVYQNSLDASKNRDVEITWSGQAPSTALGTGGKVELEVQDSGGTWRTVETITAGTGSFSQTETLSTSFDGVSTLDYRIRFANYKLKTGTGTPQVDNAAWSYHHYSDDGVVESTKIDTRDVKSFDSLDVSGSAGGNGVEVRVLDENRNVEYSTTVQPGAIVDLSSVPVDSSTRHVYVQFRLRSDGLTTPSVDGWRLLYDGNPSPNITDWETSIGGSVSEDLEVTSEIGSTDTFTVQNANQTIESVDWYLNGQLVETDTGQLLQGFTKTWQADETGTNVVRAEVNNRNGTDSLRWEVTVPNPGTVQLGSTQVFEDNIGIGGSATSSIQSTADFPGDSQQITSSVGTLYEVAVDPTDPNATYDVSVAVSDPIGTSYEWTGLSGRQVLEVTNTSVTGEQNYDGTYTLNLSIDVRDSSPTGTGVNVDAVYKEQFRDAESTPRITETSIPSAAHRGEAVNVSAVALSEITSIRETWLRVERPDGTTERRAVSSYAQTDTETRAYNDTITFDTLGTYRVTFVTENYDGLTGTSSTTYVVDVRNSPPESSVLNPPTQVYANRSFRVFWDVSDPEGDVVTETGLVLTSPNGSKRYITDDVGGAGEHSVVTDIDAPGLWAIQSYAEDIEAGNETSPRTVLDVVSKEDYAIKNVSVPDTVDAGREVSFDAELVPDVSDTTNATVYVDLKTQSGAVVTTLWSATGVSLGNGSETSLASLNDGQPTARIPRDVNGSYVVEVGVTSANGQSTFEVPVEARGLTTGEIESVSLNKQEVYPPTFATVSAVIRNTGERNTSYQITYELVRNGTVELKKTTNTTAVRPGNALSTGVGLDIPETVPPGEYTLDIRAEYPANDWEPFDLKSVPVDARENAHGEVDKVDLSYTRDVVQGYVTVENDGNVPLPSGTVEYVVLDDGRRVAIKEDDVSGIPVNASREVPVNFGFSADKNTTYDVRIRYESTVSDTTRTQFARGMPSMAVVDIDGPTELVQGQTADYTVVVKNNGDRRTDDTSLLFELRTGSGETIVQRGQIIDTTAPGETARVHVSVPIQNPQLLGQSQVTVVGQAHDDNRTYEMLPRSETVFVSAPGFIISGDSTFSDLVPGDTLTVTETFLIVGRPSAVVDVSVQYDNTTLKHLSGSLNQTITSGGTASWTFSVREPVNGKPITVVARSGEQVQAKPVSVATAGTSGAIGSANDLVPSSLEDIVSNTWLGSVLPGLPWLVYVLIQGVVGLGVVAVIEFADLTTGLSPLEKHGSAVIAFGWVVGVGPVIWIGPTVLYGIGVAWQRGWQVPTP